MEDDRHFFVHLRVLQDDGTYAPKGGITLCVVPQEWLSGRIIHVSAAICSEKDVYCKALGRQIALGRSKLAREAMDAQGVGPEDPYDGKVRRPPYTVYWGPEEPCRDLFNQVACSAWHRQRRKVGAPRVGWKQRGLTSEECARLLGP